ncbi:SatD family protein [Luteipulveratus mongoliensis]|uniref:Sigma-70 region 4 type 2 n=1 Tax=Luteipulveratus mongoliensis TaxID=571913 RepID=A0A0K1JL88_9MICO|nr:SatD family protein [Luteipulveratus mongoliensis]AKU17335.1 sigma-70 region 4 type 2 [Luteipulveratus mongoliensis]
MAQRQPSASTATVIGDLVGSRQSPDRTQVHRELSAALESSTTDHPAVETPWITAGDEFQARYDTVGDALNATFWLRLELLPTVDVRFGIGWGPVTVLDAERGIQDGPGWWIARAAIESTERGQSQPALRHLRTTYQAYDDSGPRPEAVNAALACRDHLVGSLDERSLRILRGLMGGHTKSDLAAAEGISPSAVSQRAMRDGLDTIVLAQSWLREVS